MTVGGRMEMELGPYITVKSFNTSLKKVNEIQNALHESFNNEYEARSSNTMRMRSVCNMETQEHREIN